MIVLLQVIQFLEIAETKETHTTVSTTSKMQLKPPISYVTARNCEFLKCTFVCTGIGRAYMKKFSKKYLDIHSRGKSDKNGIFLTWWRHILYLLNIFFEEYFLMSCF